jgi:hypothetical protein
VCSTTRAVNFVAAGAGIWDNSRWREGAVRL